MAKSNLNYAPQAILTRLIRLEERLSMLSTEIEDSACMPNSLFHRLNSSELSLLNVFLGWPQRVRLPKIGRLIKLIEYIESLDEEVEVFPLLEVANLEPIDLFVRFPDKEFLIFSIRSCGAATVTYREECQALYRRRGARGVSEWKPDPLTTLSDQAYHLRKERRDLFVSSKGLRKPMPKILTIWGHTVLRNQASHLYKQVGNKEFLFLPRENGACYVIPQNQIIDFIRAHLSERRNQHPAATQAKPNSPSSQDSPSSQVKAPQAESWKPPSQTTTLYFDGGDRIELGIGSGGYAIVQGTQESILGGILLQNSTVMIAEYFGLITGLRKCLEIQVTPTVVKGDNKGVIEQISGIAKVRNRDLRPLHKEAIALLEKFNPRPQLTWIPRDANSLADQACNHIMDQHIGSVWLDIAPNRARRRYLSGRKKEWIEVHSFYS